MFNLNPLTRLLQPPKSDPSDPAEGPAWWLVVFLCCTCVVGCDLAPSVLFVADGSPVRLLQLTDTQGECPAPGRVCFLSTWDGQAARGCWTREEGNVRVVLSDAELTVPVANFRPTAYAEYRNASLD
ncbi:hypothetical protein QTH97_24100 [Variovorax sp. J22R24]|uniref:hypothetical protein n=1 Tax=Variovorax gracilis TaxID=3053502 RepID=UPI002577C9C4|nr:hypothetical protein [Variovorax sp. J22R24]MDM0108052.1 hypothetical protein [Variovorax sp. J22R24]